MNQIINIVEIVLFVCVVLFPITTLLLIKKVKESNSPLVKDAVKNPLVPNIDLKFWAHLQKEYVEVTGNYALAFINKACFYCGILGFILLFILVIVNEALA